MLEDDFLDIISSLDSTLLKARLALFFLFGSRRGLWGHELKRRCSSKRSNAFVNNGDDEDIY